MGEFDSDSEDERIVVGKYELGEEIGRGTYGKVYAATHVETREKVAVKRLFGSPTTSSHDDEPTIMARLTTARHVLQIKEVVRQAHRGEEATFLVFEYMESDLESVIKATDDLPQLSTATIKSYMYMVLQGLAECHKRHVIHRDIKPNNVLLSPTGNVMLADFGMAIYAPDASLEKSFQVVTRAYRPPELLFGLKTYTDAVDMWSAGCVFAELVLRRVWLDGASDIDQLSLMFKALGNPIENKWTAATSLPFYLEFAPTSPPSLAAQFPSLSSAGVDLLTQLVTLDPTRRISASAALAHAYFTEAPLPLDANLLPLVTPPERANRKRRATSFVEDEVTDAATPRGTAAKGRRLF
ncbi:CMGC/CDK protein kinase [Saprolegnia diclina VS20]|uniref:Cyclin-dependent kinase 2 homolog n=1 Tax=Saprolegnia diclina (strain VS20) TaxID=1156394 RepID=T0RQK2_SAPDV|nr:CMGC/CDK protein kinase [Saprolegnia diclina VS20]EQC32362.1 CMGC/CDK protein kinase [Saprolegnia diclina VS20]|eukprot:XP_008614303.1 CMGC/CDK protein kinase [Saprolegnia diclina VS20]